MTLERNMVYFSFLIYSVHPMLPLGVCLQCSVLQSNSECSMLVWSSMDPSHMLVIHESIRRVKRKPKNQKVFFSISAIKLN